jgi:hypothetical protein
MAQRVISLAICTCSRTPLKRSGRIVILATSNERNVQEREK